MDPDSPQTTVADGVARSTQDDKFDVVGPATFSHGERIGRYEILDVAGRGAMGVVYAAYDPKLDRKVALKLILTASEQPSADKRRSRLLREAQALARVSHPNVVPVYDVGELQEGQVFIAMEFIEGSSFDEWLEDLHQTEGWRAGEHTDEILRRFTDAGRGLAAAHAAGLIHRDFKPQNVLTTSDGRVYVTDFGLARRQNEGQSTLRSTAELGPSEVLSSSAAAASSELDKALTRTGALLGTPAYMAPEQFRGESVGPWSDQFAFCVALYRGLFGVPPFPGRSRASLAMNVLQGKMRDRPREPKIDDRVYEALRKGLSVEAADRHADMRSLLAALTPPAPKARRVSAGLAVAGVGAIVATAFALREPAAVDRCRELPSVRDDLWSQSRQDELRADFEAADPERGVALYDGFAQRFESYVAAIDEQRRLACELPDASERVVRERCLTRRASAADAFAQALRDPTPTVIGYAISGVGGLPSVQACADATVHDLPPPDDPQVAQAVEALRVRNDMAEANLVLGRFELALAQSGGLVDEARKLGYEPILPSLLDTYAVALGRSGRTAASAAAHEEQFEIAAYNDLYEEVADAATELVWHFTVDDPNPDVAVEWGRHAKIALRKLGDPPHERADLLVALAQAALDSDDDLDQAAADLDQALALLDDAGMGESLLAAQAHSVRAQVHRRAHKEDLALESDERALEIIRGKWGSGHPRLYEYYINIGNNYILAGRLDEALEVLDLGIEGVITTLGPDHPWVGKALTYRGSVHRNLGNLEQAEADITRGLSIIQARYGPDTIESTNQLDFLATVKKQRKKYGDAVELYKRVLEVYTEVYGPDAGANVSALNNLGLAYKNMNELDLAEETFLRALDIARDKHGADSFTVGPPLNNLGEVALLRGNNRKALDYFERTLAHFEAILGPDHVVVAYPLVGMGETYAAMGQHAKAEEVLRRAIALRPEGSASIEERGEAAFLLGLSLVEQGKTQEGHERIHEASTILADAQGEAEDLRSDVERWLADNPKAR